jgi:hypothetical protein
MANNKKKSHARITYDPTQEPCPVPAPDLEDRDQWIKRVCEGFVSPSKSNKQYYRVILETLWPKGHGIPGPLIDGSQIREAIDNFRGAPYVDTFRRMRELQGEEGLLGIIKGGNKYQLIDLTVSEKRIPRTHLNDADWGVVLRSYHGVCAACGKSPSTSGFQQDHKIPRLRGGSDDLSNWQPLCDECNNFKSTACRDCQLDCNNCCWAFPEKFKPLKLSGSMVRRIRAYASLLGLIPENMVESWIEEKLPKEQD